MNTSANEPIPGLRLVEGECQIVGDLYFCAPILLHNCRLTNVCLGHYTHVADGARLTQVKMGRYGSVANTTQIGLGDHPVSWVSSSNALFMPVFEDTPPFSYNGPHGETLVGHDVWFGAGVLVPGGISIGHGAIVGAGAVVTHSVPAFAVVGGTPARFIKWRFPEDIRTGLLRSQWWNFDWPAICRSGLRPPMKEPETFLNWLDRNNVSEFTLKEIITHVRREGPQWRVEQIG